jgi:hypothetical protein
MPWVGQRGVWGLVPLANQSTLQQHTHKAITKLKIASHTYKAAVLLLVIRLLMVDAVTLVIEVLPDALAMLGLLRLPPNWRLSKSLRRLYRAV